MLAIVVIFIIAILFLVLGIVLEIQNTMGDVMDCDSQQLEIDNKENEENDER